MKMMEPIDTRNKLREKLGNLISLETSAKNSYVKDIDIFSNKKIKDPIRKIKDDEIRHIKILQDLVKMLEKNS